MKKAIKRILVIMMAIVMMSASAAMAGETGYDSSSSLKEFLTSLIPEDFDLEQAWTDLKSKLSDLAEDANGLLGSISSYISDAVDAAGEAIGEAMEAAGDATGDAFAAIDEAVNAAGEAAGGALETIEEAAEAAGEAVDDTIEAIEEASAEAVEEAVGEEDLYQPEAYEIYYDEINEAIGRHLQEETAEYAEAGDECVCSSNVASTFTDEDGLVHILGYFVVMNFDADGSDLVLKNGSSTTEMLTLMQNEDDSFEVVDFQVAEDGENYLESVTEMCDAMGITISAFNTSMEFSDLMYVADLSSFLAQHPEYEKIEYQGELMTVEELDGIMDQLIEDITI